MEKKNNRLTQPSLKGSTTDPKKNQDVSGKAWPRSTRRREPTGSSQSTKCEPLRKPNPQRNKVSFDKRPRSRGANQSVAADRNETSRLESYEEAELGSVFLPGSKKQSLNHLLNFQYAPREGHYVQNNNGQRNSKNRGHRTIMTHKHKYNKEHFLQANCQFIVNTLGDYKQYISDPDALVDWELIEQVNLQVSEFPSCPICLYPPVAAKMTRCGHIYCWSCLLHYLALSEKSWHKCPICYEAVHKTDLKSVVAIPHATFNVNEVMSFKLMKRARNSLTAYPVDIIAKEDNVIFNLSDKEYGSVYSKLVLADSSHVLSIIEREMKELLSQLNEENNHSEKCFIEQAVALLKERESNVLAAPTFKHETVAHPKPEMYDAEMPEVHEVYQEMNKEVEALSLNESCSNILEELHSEKSDGIADILNASDIFSDNSQERRKFHYFYQASDGQHLYLHPVNAKMLEHTYGSLERAPKLINGRILEKEGGSMTEDLRNRFRYLRHLPVTCQFEFAEIQLKYPVVSLDTLDHFKQQLEARRRGRKDRLKDEKMREMRIVEEENRKILGRYPAPELQLESHLQFPEFGAESRERTISEGNTSSDGCASPVSLPGSSLPSVWGGPSDSSLSFAKMLSTKASPPKWPNSKPSTSMPLQKYISVTRGNMKASTANVRTERDSDTEQGDYDPVPEHQSFGDMIAEALEKSGQHVAVENSDIEAVGKKKKKKNKKTLLLSTSMAYSGN